MPDRSGVVLTRTDNPVEVPGRVVAPLLKWSATNLRDLPWRRTRNAWHVLVSEVMLQQTQVQRIAERWPQFIELFPTPRDCADAGSASVIEQWAGLGYNRRAVNLWRAAVEVVDRFGGELPRDVAGLESLPGIGPYTARAVAAFAFEHDVGVVDTNVGRLFARWTGRSLTARQAQMIADALVPQGNGWRWNQTLFDFAVAVCTKRAPLCDECVLVEHCVWAGQGSDPAVGSAAVSRRQSRFEGSRRQVRARIVDAVRLGPQSLHALRRSVADLSAHDLEEILDDLAADGLIERAEEVVSLPGTM